MFAWIKRLFGPRSFSWGQPYVSMDPDRPRPKKALPTMTDEEMLEMVPLVKEYMSYDVLFNEAEVKGGPRNQTAKEYGVYLTSNGSVTLKMHDDCMDFTVYAIYIRGTLAMLVKNRRDHLGYLIPGHVAYMDTFLTPNQGYSSLETLTDFQAMPVPVRLMIDLLFRRFQQSPEYWAFRDGLVPATEALIDYAQGQLPDSKDPFFGMDAEYERRAG